MKFIKKSPKIDAFRFSKIPVEPMPVWLEEAVTIGFIYAQGYRNYMVCNGQDIEINEGDWIVNEDDRVLVYSPEDFEKIYEKSN